MDENSAQAWSVSNRAAVSARTSHNDGRIERAQAGGLGRSRTEFCSGT